MSDLEHRLLEVGFTWQPEKTIDFAGGAKANNKLKLGSEEVLQANPVLHDWIVADLTKLALPYEPDFVVGVPEGASGYANAVSGRLSRELDKDIYSVKLTKLPDRTVVFANEVEENTASMLTRGILIEDVINTRSSTKKALDLGSFATQVVAVAAIFDRGIEGKKHDVGRPVLSLVDRPIDPEMDYDDPIRKAYAE